MAETLHGPSGRQPVSTAPEPGANDVLETGPFVDGFSKRTVLGALFVAVVMMPGAIYLGLVAGQTLGPAAEWVTIILFAELAKRSFSRLKRQEIFVLFYVASSIAAVAIAHVALAGGPFAGAIWNQYLLQSPQTSGIAQQIPDWVVPPASSPGIQDARSGAPGLVVERLARILGAADADLPRLRAGRLAWFGLGLPALPRHVRRGTPALPSGAHRGGRRDGAGRIHRARREGRTATANAPGAGASSASARRWGCSSAPSMSCCRSLRVSSWPSRSCCCRFRSWTSPPTSKACCRPASFPSVSTSARSLAGMILPFSLVLGICVGDPADQRPRKSDPAALGAFEHWTPGNGLLVNQMRAQLRLLA